MSLLNAKDLLNSAEGFAIEAKRANKKKINFGQPRFQGSLLLVPTARESRIV